MKHIGKIVLISGPPGSGKTTIARALAEKSEHGLAVHMHTDDFYHYIKKGYVAPWLAEAHQQNSVALDAFAAAAEQFARGGYEVIVDGVIGPWFLDPWQALVKKKYDVRFVILRPSEKTTVSRATQRQSEAALTNTEALRTMWRSFEKLGDYEKYTVDTTNQTSVESVQAVKQLLYNSGNIL